MCCGVFAKSCTRIPECTLKGTGKRGVEEGTRRQDCRRAMNEHQKRGGRRTTAAKFLMHYVHMYCPCVDFQHLGREKSRKLVLDEKCSDGRGTQTVRCPEIPRGRACAGGRQMYGFSADTNPAQIQPNFEVSLPCFNSVEGFVRSAARELAQGPAGEGMRCPCCSVPA